MSAINTTTTSSQVQANAIISPSPTVRPPAPKLSKNRYILADDLQLTDAFAFLTANGYVIIGNVLTSNEISHAITLLWNWLQSLSDYELDRDDIKTWNKFPGYPQSGVIPTHAVGQSPMMWYLRDHPKVKHIFSTLWGTDRLLTSMDGCGIFRPWQYDESWKTSASWEHVDQNPNMQRERDCIQGVLSLTTADTSTGSLVVYPRSHHHFASLAPYAKNREFVKLPANFLEQYRHAHGDCIIVPAQAGDLILFDSRTIHCNTAATSIPPSPTEPSKWQLLRIVAYICMTPQYKVNELKQLQYDRWEAWRTGCTTSHWPHFLHVTNKPNPPVEPSFELNTTQKALLFGCTPEEVHDIEKIICK